MTLGARKEAVVSILEQKILGGSIRVATPDCNNAHMNTTQENDEALLGRYAGGDAAAFDQLYKRHELRVWRYVERNVRDESTADTILQEVWFTLARNTASLDPNSRFKTRLFTLAHDRVTDVLRMRAGRATPDASAGHETANALAQAVEQLPREQRQAYLLRLEGELSVGEIAEITDTTIDTTESRLRLARLRLHALLSEQT
jgi:RNA polymerase sigma factor (sigma-70 family)